MGQYLAAGRTAEFGFDETDLIVCENNITSLKSWLERVVAEIQKITSSSGPNIPLLEQLKTELGFLLK